MRWYTLFLIALLLWPAPAWAYFDEDWQITAHHLEEEVFFDLLAYQYPADWDREFHRSQNAMRATVGSISMEDFWQHHQVVLAKQMSPLVVFGYRQEEDSLYTPRAPHQEAYLAFGRDWHFDLMGYPSQDKRIGDMGWAVGYGQRHQPVYLRFSQLYQDALYNEKNLSDEAQTKAAEDVETTRTHRLEWSWRRPEGVYLQGEAVYEGKGKRRFVEPEVLRSYQARKTQGRLELGTGQIWGLKWKADQQWRVEERSSDGLGRAQDLGFYWLESYYRGPWGEGMRWQAGAQRGRFANWIEADLAAEQYRHWIDAAQVYGQLRWGQPDRGEWIASLQAGQVHLAKEYEDGTEGQDEVSIQLKGTFGYLFVEQDQWRLYLNSTWDLDFARYRQWDGGNLMVQMLF